MPLSVNSLLGKWRLIIIVLRAFKVKTEILCTVIVFKIRIDFIVICFCSDEDVVFFALFIDNKLIALLNVVNILECLIVGNKACIVIVKRLTKVNLLVVFIKNLDVWCVPYFTLYFQNLRHFML